jgi:flavin reductase (DIM6/NTAB) family NADH-FMN oxidoreductase RutF
MDESIFDALMAGRDTAVAIVTTAAGGRRAGCLIGFLSQCSIEPRRIAIWLSKANHTYRIGLTAKYVAVHFPTAEDFALAELFGTLSGDDVDKFERCRYESGPGGVPLLVDCPNRIVARRVALLDDGSDHVCITLDPIEAHGGRGDALRISALEGLVAGHSATDTAPDEA